jgi:hypothetical protein
MSDTMYDSVEWQLIPRSAGYVAVYVNGMFAADTAEVSATFPKARIFLIDVNGSDPGASIKDVETGDIRPDTVHEAINARFDAHPDALCRVYVNLSNWSVTRANINANVAPDKQLQVRWWVANPTGVPHFVPGSNGTQYSFGSQFDSSLIGRAFE